MRCGASSWPRLHPIAQLRQADFSRGAKVSFTDRHLHYQVHIGIITRCNPKTASVDSDGAAWSVPCAALRHVLDV